MPFLNKFLTIWILSSMLLGIVLGYFFPTLSNVLGDLRFGSISLPIAVGLIWMMYPPLIKVRYEELEKIVKMGDFKKMLSLSLIQNWLIGPSLMFVLAWIFLPDLPGFRTGLILVGLARCIAMVIIWNHLAEGDNEWAAILVALNSVFQIVMYSVLAYFYLGVIGSWFQEGVKLNISFFEVAQSVGIYLGVPFLGGIVTRYYFLRYKGKMWLDQFFVPKIMPTSILALLFTIIIMFALQGDRIISLPIDVIRISIPLFTYFTLMFFTTFALGRHFNLNYQRTVSLSFTAASNNFELAIAVAVSIFGINSQEAFATVIGPLIEVPVMIGLINVAFWLRKKLFPQS